MSAEAKARADYEDRRKWYATQYPGTGELPTWERLGNLEKWTWTRPYTVKV